MTKTTEIALMGQALTDWNERFMDRFIRPFCNIEYKLYRQDGTFQTMLAHATPDNRRFVEWVRQYDRYTRHGEEINERI